MTIVEQTEQTYRTCWVCRQRDLETNMVYRVVSNGESGTRKGWTHPKGKCPKSTKSAEEQISRLVSRLSEKVAKHDLEQALRLVLAELNK